MSKLIVSLTTLLVSAYAFSLSLPITIPWTILIIGLIVMSIGILTNSQKLNCLKQIIATPLTIPTLIFAIAVFFSGAANGGLSEALQSICSLRGILVYFWAYWAFKSNSNLKKISVGTMLIGGSLAGIWATIEQLTGFHPFSFAYLQGTGFLSGPMAFSGLSQIFSLLSLSIVLKKGYRELPNKLSNPAVFYTIVICNWLGVIFAAERSAWLGVIVALLITCSLISIRTTVISGVMAIISLVIGWVTLPVIKTRLSSLMNWQTDVSVKTRLILWQKAWQTYLRSPIFGVGIRQFPHSYIPEALQQGHLALDHAHSNYLHILATTGLLGLFAYLNLWLNALKIAYIEQKKTANNKLAQGISLGIFASIVSLSVSGLFEYNFGTAQVRLAEWFLLALLC